MSVTYTDLFGNQCEWTSAPSKKKGFLPNGYPARPGSGPVGETCGTCEFKARITIRSGRKFWKCVKFHSPRTKDHQWSGSISSDIRLKSPACRFWEAALSKIPIKPQNQSLRERGPFEMKETK